EQLSITRLTATPAFARAMQAQDLACPPLTHAKPRLQMLGGAALCGQAYHFFWTISSSICLSRERSATMRLRRAFSCSSALGCLAPETSDTPYFCRQR